MAKRDFNSKGKYSPSLERTRRLMFNRRCDEIDAEILRNNTPKKGPIKGPRAKFLEKYRQEGYEAAKATMHATETGRKAFPEEVLKTWIEEEQEQ